MSNFSKQQDAAFEYVVWFTSPAIARDYVMNGGEVMEMVFAGYESLRQERSVKLPLDLAAGVGYAGITK